MYLEKTPFFGKTVRRFRPFKFINIYIEKWDQSKIGQPLCHMCRVSEGCFFGCSMVDWGWAGKGTVNFLNIYIILGPEW